MIKTYTRFITLTFLPILWLMPVILYDEFTITKYISFMCAAYFGCIIPDIDEPDSPLGKLLDKFNICLNIERQHFTHSIVFQILIFGVTYGICYGINAYYLLNGIKIPPVAADIINTVPYGIFYGIAMHLFVDFFSIKEALLYPIIKRHIGIRLFYGTSYNGYYTDGLLPIWILKLLVLFVGAYIICLLEHGMI